MTPSRVNISRLYQQNHFGGKTTGESVRHASPPQGDRPGRHGRADFGVRSRRRAGATLGPRKGRSAPQQGTFGRRAQVLLRQGGCGSISYAATRLGRREWSRASRYRDASRSRLLPRSPAALVRSRAQLCPAATTTPAACHRVIGSSASGSCGAMVIIRGGQASIFLDLGRAPTMKRPSSAP